MRKVVFVFLWLMIGCSSPVEEPKDLIPKNKMAEVIADLAVNDQMGILNQNGNMETNTIFIFRKYGINSKQFSESYKYYLAKPTTLEGIYDDAQNIIKEKDPDAKDFINKKLKETKAAADVSK